MIYISKQASLNPGYTWYKIGYSEDPGGRVLSYQGTNVDIVLLSTREGDRVKEAKIHKYLHLQKDKFNFRRNGWYESKLPEADVLSLFMTPSRRVDQELWRNREKVFSLHSMVDLGIWESLEKKNKGHRVLQVDAEFAGKLKSLTERSLKRNRREAVKAIKERLASIRETGDLTEETRVSELLRKVESKKLLGDPEKEKIMEELGDDKPTTRLEIGEENPGDTHTSTVAGYGCLLIGPEDIGEDPGRPVKGKAYLVNELSGGVSGFPAALDVEGEPLNDNYYLIL